jgi:hypothetical protein
MRRIRRLPRRPTESPDSSPMRGYPGLEPFAISWQGYKNAVYFHSIRCDAANTDTMRLTRW